MISGLHHVAIHVEDMDRMLTFYRDLLGFEVIMEQDAEGEKLEELVQIPQSRLRGVLLRIGRPRPGDSQTLELIQYYTPKPRKLDRALPDVGTMHIAFFADDVPAVYEKLKAAGVPFNCPPQHYTSGPLAGWTITYLQDPEGNTLELVGVDGVSAG